MGSAFTDDDDVISGINITPFVDVVLVLLIIVMVTAPAMVRSSIQVNLPSAETATDTPTQSIGLTLSADGQLFWDGESVAPSALDARLREAAAGDEPVVALISADETLAHGRVVWLIDRVRAAGIDRFAIDVDPEALVAPIEADDAPIP